MRRCDTDLSFRPFLRCERLHDADQLFRRATLLNPRIAEADRILKRCVHCGLCTAVCSTYVVLGDERDSPRGRIYLMKDMLGARRRARADATRCATTSTAA